MRSEAAYQAKLISRIKRLLPGVVILKNNPSENQGIPDLLILFGPYWGMLEVKRSASERVQPNQEYHIRELNKLSFAAFIYPENEEQVLDDLQEALRGEW